MAEEVLVGVDVGTTSIKALAVTATGRVVGEASAPTPWRHQGPWADADPGELADAAIGVCAAAAEAAGASTEMRVLGIGVTGIAESGALIDAAGQPCAPILAWFDPRGDSSAVRAAVTAREHQRSTGRRLNSKPSLMKILWLRDHAPEARSATRHLCVAEWIVRAMGGSEVSEASLASRTGMLDILHREPWPVAVDLVGDLLPRERIWAGDPAGTAGGDDLPDILRGATLTVAGLDHQAAALISGAARNGALFDSMGTAEALIRTTAQIMDRDQIEWLTDRDIDVDWSVLPDHQILLAGRLTGLTLERIAAMVGADDRDSRLAIGVAAASVERSGDDPRLVEVSNDAVTIGSITDGVSPARVWRAVVDDLAAMAGEALDQMAEVVGRHESAVLGGGWTRNAAVVQAKRRQLGDPVFVEIPEPGALGAAFLAGVATGLLSRPGADGAARWQVSA
jgi:sugar (pentulose or hexulose) kinase